MKALVIFTHPKQRSFNRIILDNVVEELKNKSIEVKIKDLYAEKFNSLLSAEDFEEMENGQTPSDIAREQADVAWADILIFIYPIWWWGMPSMLKGWIDRVLCDGFAYSDTPEGYKPLLVKKRAIVITTSRSSKDFWNEHDMGVAVSKLSIQGVYGVIGIYDVIYKNLYGVCSASEEELKALLEEVKEIMQGLENGKNEK